MEVLVFFAIVYVLFKITVAISKVKAKQRKEDEKACQAALRQQLAAEQRSMKAKQRDCETLKKAITPAAFFNRLSVVSLSNKEKETLTMDFLERYWLACKEKSINAKTEASERKALQVYFDTLRLYDERLSSVHRARIQGHRNEFDSQYGSGIISEAK